MTISPISQTFYIGSQDTNGQDGLFVSKIDLFFETKDPVYGISLDVRTVDSSHNPTGVVLPQSNVYMTSNTINLSNNASNATTFTFPSAIYLKSDTYYAFTLTPDAGSPNYQIFVSEAGQSDLTNHTITCRQDWGEGDLYISTNDQTTTAVQDEDIKFTLYKHQFAPLSGSITLTNKDYEFFTCNTIVGTFMQGEPVFTYSNTYLLTGNVVITANSNVLTGTGTTFLTQLSPGAVIHIANTAAPLANSGWTSFVVNAIANNISLSLVQTPVFSSGNVKVYFAPSGISEYYYSPDSELHLTASTAANATFKFNANVTLVGTLTGTTAVLQSINNLPIDYFTPIVSRTAVTGTSMTSTVQVANTTLSIQPSKTLKFNDSKYLTDFSGVVASKTNEIIASSGKSFQMTLTMNSNSPTQSPTLDVRHSSIVRFNNLINNDNTNEYTAHGNAVSKYVSTTITLADGQDAEDMSLWITGYRPAGTEIEVYARLLNGFDPDNLTTKAWTKLAFVGNPRYSNPTNLLDFFDIQYQLPATPNTTVLVGAVSTTNAQANITGFSTLFTGNISQGDVLKITDYNNNRYFVSRANTDPGSNTTLTLTSNAPWTVTGATIEKFVVPNAPFKNPQNSGIVEYFAASSTFDSYKVYAIKIVLLAQATNIVPRVSNLRVVARSV
jgi:hypothetical protein